MMEPPAIVEQVKAKMSKYGDNLKHKRKVQLVRNTMTNLGYMEDLEHGYSWTY